MFFLTGQMTSTYQKKLVDLGKFEKLMVRIGVFSGLYTFPAMFVLGGHIYQYFQYEVWVEQREQSLIKCHGKMNSYLKSSTNLRVKSYAKHFQTYGYQGQIPGLLKLFFYLSF